jgi:hypothetical protein
MGLAALYVEFGISYGDRSLGGRAGRAINFRVDFYVAEIAQKGCNIIYPLLARILEQGNQRNCEEYEPDDVNSELR